MASLWLCVQNVLCFTAHLTTLLLRGKDPKQSQNKTRNQEQELAEEAAVTQTVPRAIPCFKGFVVTANPQ
jgi:hypothetical protein